MYILYVIQQLLRRNKNIILYLPPIYYTYNDIFFTFITILPNYYGGYLNFLMFFTFLS
jgi:hypothetical protein